VPRTAFYFIPSAMTGFIVSVFPFRNRVSSQEAFEGLELGEGKPSRPVLRGPGGRKAAWLLGSWVGPSSNFRVARNPPRTENVKRPIPGIKFCGACLAMGPLWPIAKQLQTSIRVREIAWESRPHQHCGKKLRRSKRRGSVFSERILPIPLFTAAEKLSGPCS
jgi:hypothetical protein